MQKIFITGGTGYIGRQLIIELLAKGHEIRALVRPGSENKLPESITTKNGSALEVDSFATSIPPANTFIHLKADCNTTTLCPWYILGSGHW